jgi:hypothetical protein
MPPQNSPSPSESWVPPCNGSSVLPCGSNAVICGITPPGPRETTLRLYFLTACARTRIHLHLYRRRATKCINMTGGKGASKGSSVAITSTSKVKAHHAGNRHGPILGNIPLYAIHSNPTFQRHPFSNRHNPLLPLLQ